jgi:dolichyl-diphosphooligosaccharide---protein glycosyltransferase
MAAPVVAVASSENNAVGKQNANKAKATTTTTATSTSTFLYDAVWWSAVTYAAYIACRTAYHIRLGAITEFGPVIHEFDPYFNYRATEVSYCT